MAHPPKTVCLAPNPSDADPWAKPLIVSHADTERDSHEYLRQDLVRAAIEPLVDEIERLRGKLGLNEAQSSL